MFDRGRLIYRLIVLLVVFHGQTAFAKWSITESVDSMTDEKLVYAFTENIEGYILGIVQQGDAKDVHLIFKLPNAIAEQLDGSKYPIYRVDKEQARDFNKKSGQLIRAEMTRKAMAQQGDRRKLVPLITKRPKQFNAAIWSKGGYSGIGNVLNVYEIMEGKLLRVRFYISETKYRETVFDLTGASVMIAKALGISQKLTSAQKENFLLERVSGYASDLCESKSLDVEEQSTQEFTRKCELKIVACSKQFDMESEAFYSCAK